MTKQISMLVEMSILKSETTLLASGYESSLPSFAWEICSFDHFCEVIRENFNKETAERVIENALDPNCELRQLNGDEWYRISVNCDRHGIVGRFTGSFRVSVTN